MSKKRFLSLAVPLFCAGLFLSFDPTKPSGDTWYEDTKTEILKQSAFKPDSVGFKYISDSSGKKEMHFYKGRMFFVKFYRKDIQTSESYFSKDGNFELRRLLCENATVSFEGIAYKTSLYGPATEYFCSGKIKMQGCWYKGVKIGTWKTFNEDGVVLDDSNLKWNSLLDSLPQIAK